MKERTEHNSIQSALTWRRERDSNPCGRVPKRFSRPPRYDHFDIPPYMNCRVADFIGYSIFLEIFLEMLFSVAFGVPKKSVFTRLFRVFATDMLANFQDPCPPPSHSRNARRSQIGFISPCFGRYRGVKTLPRSLLTCSPYHRQVMLRIAWATIRPHVQGVARRQKIMPKS